MSITVKHSIVTGPRGENVKYCTTDGQEFFDPEEATEHENSLTGSEKKVVQYEAGITSIQQAINMAVAEKRVVRFLSDKPNKELKAGITDIKGCKLAKPDRESKDIAVIPPSVVEPFDFDEVK